ncbi:hypothetical protein AMATHDRAFT_61349 [Amanita thiersii Skay4041]|uniref:histidine kinase n=1 Tax=Amanita thiersii Skay4041 TaxID=703135 RepID=A0A2A9NPX6_9AGAR|nr:hypothetical protein AMATHDRAFT_61349 [Amanita thiersii Skay4041]
MRLWLSRPRSAPPAREPIQWVRDVEKSVSQDLKSFEPSSTSTTRTPSIASHLEDSLPFPAIQNVPGKVSPRRYTPSRPKYWNGLRTHWSRFIKQIESGANPSNSSSIFLEESLVADECVSESGDNDTPQQEGDEVNQVVVDRSWTDDESSASQSEQPINPEKFDVLHFPCDPSDDHHDHMPASRWNTWTLGNVRWRIWLGTVKFFCTNYADERLEHLYAQESWFLKKSLAIWASLWLIMNWILGVIFVPKSPYMYLLDKIFYFSVAPILSIPITFMVIYDWPRDRPIIYQLVLVVSIWIWSFYQIIFIIYCGFYSVSPGTATTGRCQDRDFLGTFYYTTSLQVIALFGLNMNRLPAAVGALCFFIFTTATIVPVRISWARSMINIFVFHSFVLFVHYMRERSERRLFKLRDRLKTQYKATQKAQINERRAAESKRRLTSYVFHEVRVPLHTAFLAAQYLEASGKISQEQELEFSALSGSLSMMSKVLNDVLDFHRLDSGKFETVSRPYAFHQIMRSLFIPLQLNTEARGLKLVTNLDPMIDRVARQASYEALGESPEAIKKHLEEHKKVDGIVTGDETRLRQIVTNLTSNACKFTPQGGKISISTKLLLPTQTTGTDSVPDTRALAPGVSVNSGNGNVYRLSASRLNMHDMQQEPAATPSLDRIVVRIEITDTGCGIKASDLAHGRLFSAFNQTEEGKQQGGKGTGLGLALVRQIVKLSGGRLGVKSKLGVGSTFWVELPLGIGSKALNIQRPFNQLEKPLGSDVDVHPLFENRPYLFKNHLATTVDVAAFEATTLMDPKLAISARKMPNTTAAASTLLNKEQKVAMSEVSTSGVSLPARQPSAKESLSNLERNETAAMPTTTAITVTKIDEDAIEEEEEGCEALQEKEEIEVKAKAEAEVPDASSGSISSRSEGEQTETERGKSFTPPVQEARPSRPGAEVIGASEARPTFVQIPKQTFAFEPHPSSYSNRSVASSVLVEFDKNPTRASRSVSKPAVNIEAGMPVLVVDDDQLTRKMLERILHLQGCRVSLAENGEVALRMILRGVGSRASSSASTPVQTPVEEGSEGEKDGPILERKEGAGQERYALVFLDNHMPVLSGVSMVQKLRAMGRKDFIVGVTGNALLSDQQEYLEAGADRVLTKPVTLSSIQDILAIANERRKREAAVGPETP